jgi:hypothetical protein
MMGDLDFVEGGEKGRREDLGVKVRRGFERVLENFRDFWDFYSFWSFGSFLGVWMGFKDFRGLFL